jgi:crossover junction endodeoxyribonuclease RusA|tara:strand:- start:7611 stop:8006 length:396 start_codon:yes stop_codon:yes gene_type:complete
MEMPITKTVVPRRWVLEDREKSWTVNQERTWHFHKRAKMVRDCRERFGWLVAEQKLPRLDKVKVSIVPLAKDKRGIQDVGACLPAAKAAVDALVDMGVIPDDDPKHVLALSFYATQIIGYDGLRVVIQETN